MKKDSENNRIVPSSVHYYIDQIVSLLEKHDIGNCEITCRSPREFSAGALSRILRGKSLYVTIPKLHKLENIIYDIIEDKKAGKKIRKRRN